MKGAMGLFLEHCTGTVRVLYGYCTGTLRVLYGYSTGTLRVFYGAMWGALQVVLCDARCTRSAPDRHRRARRGTLRVPKSTRGCQGVLKEYPCGHHTGRWGYSGYLAAGANKRRCCSEADPVVLCCRAQRPRCSRDANGVCVAATPTLAPTTSSPTFAPTAPPTTPAPTTMVPTTLKPSGAPGTGTLFHMRSFTHPAAAAATATHTNTHTHANARKHTQIHNQTFTQGHKRAHMHTHTLGVLEGYPRGTRVVPRVGTRDTMGTRGVL